MFSGGSTLTVEKANAAMILISVGTSFNGPDKSPGHEGPVRTLQSRRLNRWPPRQAIPYDALLKRHEADYQGLFGRVALDLGKSSNAESLTTEGRLARFASGGDDPGLVALLFQYGRNMMIASSRPGGPPANLQGIWNESMRPPWSSNYTVNINTEMNYWPAEVANLPECHVPLFSLIESLAEKGHRTAEVNYGAHGWVAHHNTDIWAQTAPVGNYGSGDPMWANWEMGGAWLSTHLWEHYAFGQDKRFLRDQAWPLMTGAVAFCLDWLVEDGRGHLTTAPSTSPGE